ncbi:hypothetical protein BBK36DRAFT_1170112 [Trichoderma citrinoviride]|uniref:Uncharacterized protein n=1 Tax=Trichoderma citrinoviride TaxID=58853 RepID=A0A2T4B7Q0_9HYPO|nr:hypothetical protein BBK36DRAFT_1170112 [Trichoderma citrinoviride]PTB65356.1 hypothetical protein BBK36DRAFT_1170112 [Trichoderma citrinoviride]
MSTGVVQNSDDRGDTEEATQREIDAQLVGGPFLRSRGGEQISYAEDSETDAGVTSTIGEKDELAYVEEDDSPKKTNTITMGNFRKTRSQAAKEESMDSGPQKQSCPPAVPSRKRTCNDDEGELRKPTKRGRKSSANAELKKFEKDIRGLSEKFGSKLQELDAARSEAQDLHAKVTSLEQQLGQAQREIQDYEDHEAYQSRQIDILKEESSKWRVTASVLLEEAKRDSGKYVKVSDSDITERWKTLSFNIRNLVSQYLTERFAQEKGFLELLAKGHPLSPSDSVLKLRTSILRQGIWRCIISAAFLGKKGIWQGGIGNHLTNFLSGKHNDVAEDTRYFSIISQIKSRAVADLSEELHLNAEALDAHVNGIGRNLRCIIPGQKMDNFKEELKRLTADAVDLHAIMMKSKAIFQVQWIGDNNAPYDRTKMDSVLGDIDDAFVKFIEAPGLVKIGNADGEHFEHSMVLCRSQVILQQKEEFRGKGVERDVEVVQEDSAHMRLEGRGAAADSRRSPGITGRSYYDFKEVDD